MVEYQFLFIGKDGAILDKQSGELGRYSKFRAGRVIVMAGGEWQKS